MCQCIWWIWILNDHRYQLCHSYHVWTLNKYIHYALRSPARKLCWHFPCCFSRAGAGLVEILIVFSIAWPVSCNPHWYHCILVHVIRPILFRCASISWIHVEESVSQWLIHVFEIWAYLGHILSTSWAYLGHILGISRVYLRHILGISRAYLGFRWYILDRSWA